MAKLRTAATHFVAIVLLSGFTVPITSATGDIVIEAQDSDQREMAEWAVGRFHEAGLDLPTLIIRFPGLDSPLCDGVQGRAYLSADPIEVRMCWNDEFILLHELAHVWEGRDLTDAKRESFMDLRAGVASWASNDDLWSERGREHAANVIAWGLLENPYPISRTYPNDVPSMIEAFRFLTGFRPLHDGGPGLQFPDRSQFANTGTAPLESGR